MFFYTNIENGKIQQKKQNFFIYRIRDLWKLQTKANYKSIAISLVLSFLNTGTLTNLVFYIVF